MRAPGRIPLTVACGLLAAAAGQARAAREVAVPLIDYVKQVRIFMPGEGSNGYVVPTSEERAAFSAAATALLSGDVVRAEAALSPYPDFEVLDYRDGPGGASYLVIAEKEPLSHGWGFFFFARKPSRPGLLIEAPHPLADRDSELLAARAVTSLHPAAFLLAGAHRYSDTRSSDMTHTVASAFESVHEVVVTPAHVVLQLHGFSSAAHPGYPDAILSTGTTQPSSQGRQLCDDLVRASLQCALYTGDSYTDLGAQTNVQGAHTRLVAGDGHFLHLETGDSVRDDQGQGDAVIHAIAARWPAQGSQAGCAAGPSQPAHGAWLFGVALAAGLATRPKRQAHPR